ncbi:PPC domain-containing protein [Halalkalicoccus ordinarius]|uniref:PPC domain-containing protein n=1 Tax=Halalkalicoccus ordinarius TaxID=3116651 RepID=UPI00300F463E
MKIVVGKVTSFAMILCLVLTAMVGPGSATGWVEDEWNVPNDGFESAGVIYSGDTVSGQMSDYDQDFYAIEVTDQQSLIVETRVGTGADVQLAVYDPHRNQVKHWIQAQGTEGTVTVPTPENGTYYIHVYTGQYANLVTNYSVAVSVTPYAIDWGFVSVLLTVGGIAFAAFGGAYGVIRRRRGKPIVGAVAGNP